jgi:KipI family sensor histidine kinase inhibitor
VFHVKHRWITERGLWLESGEHTLALCRRVGQGQFDEVEELIPGDGSLVVVLKLGRAPGGAMTELLFNGNESEHDAEMMGNCHVIPVSYGGEAGPDLAMVAEEAGLTLRQAAELHSSAEYRVGFLGFQPGFAYLFGTPEELQLGRRVTPRPRVAAGTVAIGGGYTGIYPGFSPGGWQLIGHTTEWLFDPARTCPARFAPGDRVRFVPK